MRSWSQTWESTNTLYIITESLLLLVGAASRASLMGSRFFGLPALLPTYLTFSQLINPHLSIFY